ARLKLRPPEQKELGVANVTILLHLLTFTAPLNTRHWPMEPGSTGDQLDHRQRHFWVAFRRGEADWARQSVGRVDCGRSHGDHYGLLRRSWFAVQRGRRAISLCARHFR